MLTDDDGGMARELTKEIGEIRIPRFPHPNVIYRSFSSVEGYTSTSRPSALGMAILRASGGDANLAAAIRSLAWESYLGAGYPYGYSESGLERWWEQRLLLYNN
ncbi:MAG: hypothetical protein R3284_04535 [Rubricoccaceae bacterium]|nr:hypothetical protein [Rubricoccaceae bacterium]